MKTSLFLVAALLASSSLTLMAATPKGKPSGPPPLPPELLAKYDTNGDGKLDATELAAMQADMEAQRKALIAKYDANGDGVLDAAERAAMEADLKAQRLAEQTAKFATLDADASGGLTLAEFTAGAPTGATADQIQAAFTRLDTDKDGLISLAEFTAEPARHDGPPPGGKGPGGRGPGGKGGPPPSSGTGSGSGTTTAKASSTKGSTK